MTDNQTTDQTANEKPNKIQTYLLTPLGFIIGGILQALAFLLFASVTGLLFLVGMIFFVVHMFIMLATHIDRERIRIREKENKQ